MKSPKTKRSTFSEKNLPINFYLNITKSDVESQKFGILLNHVIIPF